MQPLPANGIKPQVTDLITGNKLSVTDSFDEAHGVVGVRFPMTGAKKQKFDFSKAGETKQFELVNENDSVESPA